MTHNIAPALQARATPIDDLHPHPKNARRRDSRAAAALAESLATNGQYRTVIARRIKRGRSSRLQLLAGHGTVEAARELGWDEVAVDVHEGISDAAAARIVLVDNRTSDLAGYDEDLLAELLAAVPDLTGTGYEAEEVARIMAAAAAGQHAGGLTDQDAAPPAPDVPLSRPGDAWLLGPRRLVVGDATQGDVWNLLMGGLADAVWTDPPYGVDYEGKTAEALKIEGDGRDLGQLEVLLEAAFAQTLERCRPGAAWYVAAPAGPATLAFAKTLAAAGVWRQTLVWVKHTFALGHSDYHYRHEVIYQGYGPSVPGTGRRGRGSAGWYGPNNADSVFEVDKPARNAEHPTMKPVELIVAALENSTAPGMTVVDPFAGSGSTLIACHATGRVARLVELDPRYADVICRRYQEHTGTVPVLEATGKPVDFTGGEGEV